jgi:short-subunit dehydrogenase
MVYKSKKIHLKGKKILVTGASSGIGRALVKKLIEDDCQVWGIARRKELLESLKKEIIADQEYFYSVADLTNDKSWRNVLNSLKKKNFNPEIIVFCAAIFANDLNKQIDFKIMNETFKANYFSILKGIDILIPYVKRNAQFILISTTSSQKGSSVEGLGYGASKAAISIAFESLQQIFKNRFKFKTVFLGPVKTGMNPFSKHSFLTLSTNKAVGLIIDAIKGNNIFYYRPKLMFFVLKSIKLFSQKLYFWLLRYIDELHINNQKK